MNRGRHARSRPHHRPMRRADLRHWWATTDVRPSDRLVYAALWSHTNPEGWCWPSQGQLVADTRLARSTVQASLHRLTTLGEIVPKPRLGGSTAYYLSPARPSGIHRPDHRAGVPDGLTKGARPSGPKELEGCMKDAPAAQPRPNGAAAGTKPTPLSPTTNSDGTHLPGTGNLRWASEVLRHAYPEANP